VSYARWSRTAWPSNFLCIICIYKDRNVDQECRWPCLCHESRCCSWVRLHEPTASCSLMTPSANINKRYRRSGPSPFPQIDIIGAMVIVWRIIGLSVLCNIVCNNCAQCTHIWTDLTVLWNGFCLTGPISLCLDSFLCMYVCVFCIWLYIACMCSIVTWWGRPGGIEAYP